MRYLGLDLAWGERGRTGVAALDEAGRLIASASVRTDDEIAAFAAGHAPGPCTAAIDAPLIVPNAAGRRPCEAMTARLYGRYHAGPYPANRSSRLFDPEPPGWPGGWAGTRPPAFFQERTLARASRSIRIRPWSSCSASAG